MKYYLIAMWVCLSIILSGCSRSFIILDYPKDANTPISAEGQAANILAQQVANNMQTEAGRLAELFKYNSALFVILFVIMILGVIFAVITKSSWGWVIPAATGAGLLSLVFIVQAAVYIKWIVLAVIVIAFIVVIYKAYEYQKERNQNQENYKAVLGVENANK